MRVAVSLLAVLALAGCAKDARFIDAHRGDVEAAYVRWEGRALPLERGSEGFDEVVEEALQVLGDVVNVHRRAFSQEDVPQIREGTGNVQLNFSRGVRDLPDYPHPRDAASTRAIIVLSQETRYVDGNVLLCGEDGCGEWTSERDLAKLRRIVERAASDA